MKHTRELNLELGWPTVDQALRRLDAELEAARKMNTPLMKLIHGYGSSGKGGRICTASRRYLEEAAAQGRIAAYLPGERFSIFDETARRALQQYPHLRQDRDLDGENRGVTFVFLRKLGEWKKHPVTEVTGCFVVENPVIASQCSHWCGNPFLAPLCKGGCHRR